MAGPRLASDPAPAFVDHHTHLLRAAAGVPAQYSLATPASIAEYHRRVAAGGTTPMDEGTGEPAVHDLEEALLGGLSEAAALGLVGVTEAGMADWRHWDALVELRRREGGLPVAVRILVASGAADLERMEAARRDSDDDLAVIGVKFYGDGWLGPRTCACSVPFADRPGADRGILFLDQTTLAKRAAPYAEAGWLVATHAIGDRAIKVVLSAYRSIYGGAAGCREAAPRIEHAQLLRPDLVAAMAELGVAACIQPCFASSDARSVELALAGRFPHAYRWDRLLEAGVAVVAGSDYPIEPLDPKIGLERLCTGDHALDGETARRLMTTPLPPPR